MSARRRTLVTLTMWLVVIGGTTVFLVLSALVVVLATLPTVGGTR